LGDFFGDEHEYNIKCLDYFTDKLNMRGMEIDEAMRYFLSYFTLPGEGQKIDRIV